MSNKILGAYKYEHFANKGKVIKLLETLKEYRNAAQRISRLQWQLFWKEFKFDKNLDIKSVKTELSERYKQTCQYQVVGVLESFISNVSNRFAEIVVRSALPEKTKRVLIYLNVKREWLKPKSDKAVWKHKEETIEYEITKEERLLAKKIFKHIFKTYKKPSFSNIAMHLDQKVAVLKQKQDEKAKSFDYWVAVSTLQTGKRTYIPLKDNSYAKKLDGKLLNFVQIMPKENTIEIRLVKELSKKEYKPETEIIAIDLGLNPLFATDKGDLFGRKFFDLLKEFDNKITKRLRNLQKNNIKPLQDKKYKQLVQKLRDFLKNEINRMLNKIISSYKPKSIILEKLDFRSPELSKRLNRLISNFGKKFIKEKLNRLQELYGIAVTFINPAYTSQTCSSCGYIDKNNRKDTQVFKCKACGNKINAQVNGAKNILKRSSLKGIKTYTPKKKVLSILVEQYVERLKGCNSAPLKLLNSNPYFKDYFGSFEPLARKDKRL